MLEGIRRAMEQCRARTLELLAPLNDAQLTRQYTPLLSPVIWDLAHIANYEEQWLVRALGGERVLPESKEKLYDALRNPRRLRGELELLSPHEAYVYAAEVRRRALEILDHQSFDDGRMLTRNGFVYGMVLQHEHQHCETILAAIAAMEQPYALAPRLNAKIHLARERREELHEGGDLVLGSFHPFAYDNERPAHPVVVAPFFLDRFPVTNGEWLQFMEEGGYEDHRFWTQAGYAEMKRSGIRHPLYWMKDEGGRWLRKRFGQIEPLPHEEPVQHVSFFEAEAYARWAGKRLPTEIEWEFAAQSAPLESSNLWHDGLPHRYAPVALGSLPDSASNYGVEQLFGDVWEWTSSSFDGYPGFESFPYREYSEVFFDGRSRVLRGGSWATHPLAMRKSFRNWDFPERRHIFTGLRLARSADSRVHWS